MRRLSALPAPWLGLLRALPLGLVACGGPAERAVRPSPTGPTLRVEDDGSVTLRDEAGALVMAGITAEALVEIAGQRRTLGSCGWEPGRAPALADDGPPLPGLISACTDGGVTLHATLVIDDDAVHARVTVENGTTAPLTVWRFTPLAAEGGGPFLGADVGRVRILDNGQDVVRDTETALHHPEQRAHQALVDAFLPVPARGALVSNWSHALADLDTGRAFTAGALTVERALPAFGTTLDAPARREGRSGFSGYHADQLLVFEGKAVEPGARLSSEPVWVDVTAPSGQAGLERLAVAIARAHGVTPWTRDHPVPNGWNSWTGSSGTGGLGTAIDEGVLGENLAVMAREFAPFGVDWFQIDDGYQVANGDWVARADRFPAGMPALVDDITAAGLTPGFWVAAFRVDTDSALAAEHPDWLLPPENNRFGALLDPGADARMLDLSHPEVRAWLTALARRYHDDWGSRWLKLDFAYYALAHTPVHDRTLTSVEAYKAGLRAVKAGVGGDGFLLGIALMGPNYGVADGVRLTLDDGPRWDQDNAFSLLGEEGSFKTTARTTAHRWFYGNRVWVNHADLLFFRTGPNSPAPVTLAEATTLTSFFGLSGSVIKFGEDLRTLTPEQVNVWRRILPGYPATARPLDVFTRLYPEVHALPIHGTLAGSPDAWTVLGVLHWGENHGYDGPEVALLPDAARDYSIALTEAGLDPTATYVAHEFWSEQYLGEITGALQLTVPPHEARVVALRPARAHPQLLGHNRHLTQGGTDLIEERWDAATRTLLVALEVDQGATGAVPFEYQVAVRRAGATLVSVEPAGVTAVTEGEVVRLTFTPAAPGRADLRLHFE